MICDLKKDDLVNLVKGTSPHYELMDNPLVKRCGSYIGGFHDRWDWNNHFDEDITEQQLWDLYILCK